MTAHLINSKLLETSEQLGRQFVEARPFEHLIIDDFLEPEFCQQLLSEFPHFNEKLALNENGAVGGKSVHERVSGLGPAYKRLDLLAKSDTFIQLLSQLTGISDLLYDPHYFGGGTHDNKNGQALDPHVDFTHHPMTDYYRRINLIIYLNEQWDSDWGGNIELHKNPYLRPEQDEIVSVVPAFNRAVLFATHHTSWHGFPEINIPADTGVTSRKSFALYYYTKQKPEYFQKPHSTIYVDRHISANIKAGYTLTETDEKNLERLMQSRYQHNKRLYATISHQMHDLQKLKKVFGPLWTLSWPLRKLRKLWRK